MDQKTEKKAPEKPVNDAKVVVANPLPTNRGFFKRLFLTLITFGIYDLYIIHAMAHDVNVSCAQDGKKTSGLAAYIFLSLITIGIYGIVWHVKICNRFADRLEKAGQKTPVTGTSWFMWNFFGALIIVGPCIAMAKELKGLNRVNELFNQGK